VTDAPSQTSNAFYLFVAGNSRRNRDLAKQIKSMCREHFEADFDLDVIDVTARQDLAKTFLIFAVPTLIRVRPAPMRRINGDFSDPNFLRCSLVAHEERAEATRSAKSFSITPSRATPPANDPPSSRTSRTNSLLAKMRVFSLRWRSPVQDCQLHHDDP
jgi:circadian clock protein KaiB